MSSFFKKMEKDLQKAAHNMANPNELGQLDELVEGLVKNYDKFLSGLQNDGTPYTREQAAEEEEKHFATLNEEYDRKAVAICNRQPKNKDDNISVRKRQLNRQLESRRGKLFSKFASEVEALTSLAAATLANAKGTTDDFDDSVRAQLPLPDDVLVSEFEKMKLSIHSQVESSFPGGLAALDNYDDALPDNIPSWKVLQEAWPGVLTAVQEENRAAAAAAVEALKIDSKETLNERINEAIREVLAQARASYQELQLPYLEGEAMSRLRDELAAAADDIEAQRLPK